MMLRILRPYAVGENKNIYKGSSRKGKAMIKKSGRAQSALEFLFTYAWAFLIILIMIAALAFFGVLDPAKFLPDKCLATTGFACVESRVQV